MIRLPSIPHLLPIAAVVAVVSLVSCAHHRADIASGAQYRYAVTERRGLDPSIIGVVAGRSYPVALATGANAICAGEPVAAQVERERGASSAVAGHPTPGAAYRVLNDVRLTLSDGVAFDVHDLVVTGRDNGVILPYIALQDIGAVWDLTAMTVSNQPFTGEYLARLPISVENGVPFVTATVAGAPAPFIIATQGNMDCVNVEVRTRIEAARRAAGGQPSTIAAGPVQIVVKGGLPQVPIRFSDAAEFVSPIVAASRDPYNALCYTTLKSMGAVIDAGNGWLYLRTIPR